MPYGRKIMIDLSYLYLAMGHIYLKLMVLIETTLSLISHIPIELQTCHSPGKENLNDSAKKSERLALFLLSTASVTKHI